MMPSSLLSVLLLVGTALAQVPSTPPKIANYRGNIDVVIDAMRKAEHGQKLPSLGGDSVLASSQILCAMANCHRCYHISDGPVVRPTVDFVAQAQQADGSFGDANTTAWAIVALATIDSDGQRAAVKRGQAWLAKRGGVSDPFAARVEAMRTAATAGQPVGANALSLCKRWLADPSSAALPAVADGLCELVACQVASRPATPTAGIPAATFSPAQQHGIDWLMTQQHDGVFLAGNGKSAPLTGFGLMALQSKPKELRTPVEQAAIDKGLQWLLSTQNANGTWGEELQNYTTCVAVGALDRWHDASTAPALAKAQKALLGFQNVEANGYSRGDRDYGSIGYGDSQRGDISNTQFAMQALRQTGLSAQDEAFAKAVVFLQRTQNLAATNDFAGKVADPDRPGVILDVVSGDDGGAGYYPGNSSAGYLVQPDGKVMTRSYGSTTYALLKTYSLAGLPASDVRVKAAVTWIQEHWDLAVNPGAAPELGPKAQYQGLFYYYLLMAQALDLCGIKTVNAHHGDQVEAIDWRTALREHLEQMQVKDGTWLNDKNSRWMEGVPMLCTCYALLALEHCR
jgi:hypothetical protein